MAKQNPAAHGPNDLPRPLLCNCPAWSRRELSGSGKSDASKRAVVEAILDANCPDHALPAYRNLAIDRLPDKQGWSRLDGLGRFSQNRPAERQGHWRCQSTLLPGQERPYQAQFSQAAERISSEVEQFPGRELHHYV